MSTDINSTILAFVQNYVETNHRGCPKGALLHVGGFKAKDIAAMIDAGTLEAGRGSEGGLFPAGAKPAPKGDTATLKGEAFALLRILSDGVQIDNSMRAKITSLVEQYDAECAARRKV